MRVVLGRPARGRQAGGPEYSLVRTDDQRGDSV
jgi:hypothetical protein